MEKLRLLYKKLQETPFPSYPENQELADIFEELALLDGAYMGLAGRFLNGDKVFLNDISDIVNVCKKIDDLSKSLHPERNLLSLQEYAEIIKNIALEMKHWG